MEDARQELATLMQDKKNNYAKYVREVHLPIVSLKKQQELKHLKDKLKHPVRQSQRICPGLAVSFKQERSQSA